MIRWWIRWVFCFIWIEQLRIPSFSIQFLRWDWRSNPLIRTQKAFSLCIWRSRRWENAGGNWRGWRRCFSKMSKTGDVPPKTSWGFYVLLGPWDKRCRSWDAWYAFGSWHGTFQHVGELRAKVEHEILEPNWLAQGLLVQVAPCRLGTRCS